ncbi:MAG TPA: response regulator [Desulfobacterales bacterium]|nr:response regulator [Desulfobacterales bacterium]
METDASAPLALLVDDDEAVLQIGSRILAKLGLRVLTAETGGVAVDLIVRHPGEVRLVVFDFSMPGVAPEALFDRMRAAAPEARFLLASGYSRDASVQAVLDRGCHGFIQKPFRMDELKQALQGLMRSEA